MIVLWSPCVGDACGDCGDDWYCNHGQWLILKVVIMMLLIFGHDYGIWYRYYWWLWWWVVNVSDTYDEDYDGYNHNHGDANIINFKSIASMMYVIIILLLLYVNS